MFTNQFKVLLGLCVLLIILAGVVINQTLLTRRIQALNTRVAVNEQMLSAQRMQLVTPTASPTAVLKPVRSFFVPSKPTVAPTK